MDVLVLLQIRLVMRERKLRLWPTKMYEITLIAILKIFK